MVRASVYVAVAVSAVPALAAPIAFSSTPGVEVQTPSIDRSNFRAKIVQAKPAPAPAPPQPQAQTGGGLSKAVDAVGQSLAATNNAVGIATGIKSLTGARRANVRNLASGAGTGLEAANNAIGIAAGVHTLAGARRANVRNVASGAGVGLEAANNAIGIAAGVHTLAGARRANVRNLASGVGAGLEAANNAIGIAAGAHTLAGARRANVRNVASGAGAGLEAANNAIGIAAGAHTLAGARRANIRNVASGAGQGLEAASNAIGIAAGASTLAQRDLESIYHLDAREDDEPETPTKPTKEDRSRKVNVKKVGAGAAKGLEVANNAVGIAAGIHTLASRDLEDLDAREDDEPETPTKPTKEARFRKVNIKKVGAGAAKALEVGSNAAGIATGIHTLASRELKYVKPLSAREDDEPETPITPTKADRFRKVNIKKVGAGAAKALEVGSNAAGIASGIYSMTQRRELKDYSEVYGRTPAAAKAKASTAKATTPKAPAAPASNKPVTSGSSDILSKAANYGGQALGAINGGISAANGINYIIQSEKKRKEEKQKQKRSLEYIDEVLARDYEYIESLLAREDLESAFDQLD